MPRTKSLEKFELVVLGAGRVFARLGYNRALMSDIADEAGVALGTLYRYAETKEELFELALRHNLGEPPDDLWAAGRSATGFASSVLDFARTKLNHREHMLLLQEALRRPAPPDSEEELRDIVGQLYDVLSQYHISIRMVDRSSGDWPALAGVFSEEVRAPLVRSLTRYLEYRCAAGVFRRPPDFPSMARFILETCATHAMHRRFTPGGPWTDDRTARVVTVHSIAAALEVPTGESGHPQGRQV